MEEEPAGSTSAIVGNESPNVEESIESKTEVNKANEESSQKAHSKDGLGVKVKRKSRRGRSSGSLTMKGDKITSFTTERGVTYQPNDHVYIENNKPNQPYYLCCIVDFSVVKRDTLVVKVKWYYRVSEVPDSVLQHLIQDRYSQQAEGDDVLDPIVKSRELFCSEATDTYPVTALRGKCKVVQCNTLEAVRSFKPAPDSFYCLLGYNPETKRLATTQGQIRVGSMYQARMPECKPNVTPREMPERCEDMEEFRWQPKSVLDGDLMMYLRAARSVAAFAGMCDGGSTEDGCQAAAMDDTTMNAMNVLHRFEYDTGKALQALVKAPALRTIDKKWNEEDTKRFVKGLRVYSKNFFKIRKELLPHKETGDLVEYYYYWKKTPAAAANRPHRRHRKHGVKRAQTRSQRPASSEFLDLSSGSDSDNDSEDSDGVGSGYRCHNCLVTVSKDWSNAGKPNPRLCSKCRIFFKKYGVDRPIETSGDSPYFQPVKDGDLGSSHNMLTRQSRNSTDSKDKKKGPNSVSSIDNLDSSSSESKKSLVPSSPSALSTCSNSSTDRKKKKRKKLSESSDKDKKRHLPVSDSEDKFSKRKREGRSDSDSVSDSSISGAEETPNDGDIETNQDDLTSSSPPTTPSPVVSDYKQDKSTPVTIPAESQISEQLSGLPRPEPQHPTLGLQNLEVNPLFQLPGQLSVSSAPPLSSQGFVPLPPLPAFDYRQQCPLPDATPMFQRPPFAPPSASETFSESQKAPGGDSGVGSITSPFRPCDSDNKVEPRPMNGGFTHPKVKEEVQTPPPSPKTSVMIKQEPRESVAFMPQAGSSVASASSSDSYAAERKQFELLTPKHEPGLISPSSTNPAPMVSLNIPQELNSRPNPLPSDLSLASRAEVKGQTEILSEMKGHLGESRESDRPKSVELEIMDESDSDHEGTLTPGPVPTPCNKEILRSKSAIFIKLLNRGEHNSCSRCDLMFRPLPDSKLAKKREEREKRMSAPTTPLKEETMKRKSDTPPPNSSADAHVISNLPSSHPVHQDRITPRSYPDTPALRQLSEYAKPHALGQDPRGMPGYMGFSPFMDHIRMAGMYPPNSRERLELELERDKRERDARERELREQELRTMEMREKLKAELEMKPPGLERLLPPGANPLDPHWLEMQRRYGPHMLPGSSGSHIPGVYPPTSLASDLMARERERLERLGLPPGHPMLMDSSYAALMERLSAERMSAERMSAERIQAERLAMQDPILRLQMSSMSGAAAAAAAAAAQQHAHTHTHAHSHTHLHLHQPDLVPPPVGPTPMPPTSTALHHHLLPPHLLHSLPPGADPMSGVNGGSTQTPPGSLSSLPVGVPPHLLGSREQELLQSDLYRRAYADPALAQQLHAQHEAIQRMVMDRERFGSGLPPPH